MPSSSSQCNAHLAWFVGVDISAKSASVALTDGESPPQRAFTVAQSATGMAALLKRLREEGALAGITLVTMEATGTYWVRMATQLHDEGYAVNVASPARARAFAIQQGIRSKADDIDARMLAQLAATMPSKRWQPPSEAMLRLQVHARHRASLGRMLVSEQVRLHALDQLPAGAGHVRLQILEHIDFLRSQMATAVQAASETIAHDAALTEAAGHLATFKGFGPITIMTLLAETAAFAHCLTAEQAVAYAGLDPKQHASGGQRGKTRISKQGNRHLRRMLYFAALRALQHHPAMEKRYQRLVDAGKPKKAAVIAIARRLLVLAWTLVRHKRDFDPNWTAARRQLAPWTPAASTDADTGPLAPEFAVP